MSLVMIISLPIFSIFLSTLTFGSLDHIHWKLAFVVACAFSSFVYFNIDTYLSRVVTLVMRFEPVTTPTAVQRIHHLCR